MSSAVLFLLSALGASVVGPAVLWIFSNRHRRDEPDYYDQLRAIAPSATQGPIEQPSGIGPLDELTDEDL